MALFIITQSNKSYAVIVRCGKNCTDRNPLRYSREFKKDDITTLVLDAEVNQNDQNFGLAFFTHYRSHIIDFLNEYHIEHLIIKRLDDVHTSYEMLYDLAHKLKSLAITEKGFFNEANMRTSTQSFYYIEILKLNHCSISDESLSVLLDFIKSKNHKVDIIKDLSLRDNRITHIGFRQLLETFKSSHKKLITLDISKNFLHAAGFNYFCDHLKEWTDIWLKQIDLSENDINAQNMNIIDKPLKYLKEVLNNTSYFRPMKVIYDVEANKKVELTLTSASHHNKIIVEQTSVDLLEIFQALGIVKKGSKFNDKKAEITNDMARCVLKYLIEDPKDQPATIIDLSKILNNPLPPFRDSSSMTHQLYQYTGNEMFNILSYRIAEITQNQPMLIRPGEDISTRIQNPQPNVNDSENNLPTPIIIHPDFFALRHDRAEVSEMLSQNLINLPTRGTILAPILLQYNHWVGVTVYYDQEQGSARITYANSLGYNYQTYEDSILTYLNSITDFLRTNMNIASSPSREQDLIIQRAFTNDCGPIAIEQMVAAYSQNYNIINENIDGLMSGIRNAHRDLLERHNTQERLPQPPNLVQPASEYEKDCGDESQTAYNSSYSHDDAMIPEFLTAIFCGYLLYNSVFS